MMGLPGRMKAYESAHRHTFPPNSVVAARVDGRSFSRWTRKANKPFDATIEQAMVAAMTAVAKDMAGFLCAYHQSDEATFLFTDMKSRDADLWFGGVHAKITSIVASRFTAYFNHTFRILNIESDRAWFPSTPAEFDCRAFTVPPGDAANVIVWRQRDWERNSVQMLARHHFSQSQLHGADRAAMHEMLHSIGINWADLEPRWKNGTCLLPTPDGVCTSTERLTWETIEAAVGLSGLTP